MLSSDFLFPRFFVVPLANPSNFSHCKCFSSWLMKHPEGSNAVFFYGGGGGGGASMIWPRRKNDSEFNNLPIAIAPGGGGASAVLDYDSLESTFQACL